MDEGQSPTGEVTSSSESSGINPAWNDVLSILPEQFHGVVTPHFQKWDQSAQERITELNGKVKDFESFSPLLEHGITMDQVQQALLLNQEINTNPRAIYDALNEAYNYSNAQQQQQTPVDQNSTQQQTPTDNPWEAKYNELRDQMSVIAQLQLQQEEAKQASQADSKLEGELNAAMQKFPDVVFDGNTQSYILNRMYAQNESAEQAFQNYVDFRNSLAPQPFAPQVIGQGGGVPSQAIDVTQLSRQDTRNLVAKMLEAGARNNR